MGTGCVGLRRGVTWNKKEGTKSEHGVEPWKQKVDSQEYVKEILLKKEKRKMHGGGKSDKCKKEPKKKEWL